MEPDAAPHPRQIILLRWLYPLFFLSGAAGLIYQVVWSKLLYEIFGVTVQAVTAVLATFLGGLALGGWWLGRLADRSRNLVRLYGLLELGIGLAAIAGTLLLPALVPPYEAAASRFGPHSPLLAFVRILLASLVVLPATLLMGATLPAITRAFVSRATEAPRELASLYALNTAGAVAGCLAAGFLLIRSLGLHASLASAVGLNLLVGAISLLLARSAGSPERESSSSARPAARGGTGILAVMALSGFVSLGLEVLWTRMLILVLGTTAYAFVIVLASFLTGIALGSALVRIGTARLVRPRRLFGWLQVAIAASSLATLPLLGSGAFALWFEGLGSEWLLSIFARFGVSFLILLVPATLIGATFPVAAAVRLRDLGALGADLGQLYGANTLGNVAGAVVTGFVLLPLFGLQRGVALLAALALVAAGWGLLEAERIRGRRALLRPGLVAAAWLGTIALLVLWRPAPFIAGGEEAGDRTLFYREGVTATVKVVESATDPRHLWMAVDGIRIGESIGGVDAKQQALAHFPFLLMAERAPREVLSIGLGTAVLIGEVARHDVDRADCVEISPEVIAGARHFEAASHGALHNPRVHVIYDDGYHYLRRTDERYDAIISDAKSRRAHAGNSLFFSRDYYELCRKRLAPDGLLIQWVPLDAPPRELAIILRTLSASFPHAYVWIAPPHSLFLVGTERPLTLDLAHVERVLADPATADLLRYGFTDAYGFASALALDRAGVVARFGEAGLRNTLERPVLEFYVPKDYAEAPWLQRAENLDTLRPAAGESPDDLRVVNADAALLAANRAAAGLLLESSAIAERAKAEEAARGLALVEQAIALAPENGWLRYAAAGTLARFLPQLPPSAQGQALLGSLLESRGLLSEATVAYRRALEAAGGADVTALHRLGVLRARAGDTAEARELLDRALRLAPEDATLHLDSGRVWLLTGRPEEAVRAVERAAELTGRRDAAVLETLSDAYAAAGLAERARAARSEAFSLAR